MGLPLVAAYVKQINPLGKFLLRDIDKENNVKQFSYLVLMVIAVGVLVGCSTPAKKVKNISLGMTPEEVRDQMGDPYTIRAAKMFEDGQSTEVWEYQPQFMEFNPKTFWIYFENRKVVQWGEPGDFAGKSGRTVPVDEYRPFKKAN
jgi:hypothetical protein